MPSQEELLGQILEQLKSQGVKGTASSPGIAPTTAGAAATGVIGGLIEDLGKVRQGASATGTVLNDIAGVLGKVWAPLGALGSQQVQALQGTVGSMNTLNQQGVNFGQNIANFNDKLSQAGVTPEKFTQIMQTVGPRLQGLGVTGGQAADQVLTAMGEFKTKYGAQLNQLGMSNDQQAEYFAKYLQDRKFTDLADKNARRSLIDEVGVNAQEMSRYASMSGKTVAQLQAEQNARSENLDVQAEIMMGGKEMQEAFGRINTQLGDLGPGINDLAGEILTGGIRTAEGSAKFAALGPAGAELEKAILAQKNAKTAEEKVAADQALTRAKNNADEYMRSKEFLRNLQNDKSEVGQAQRQFFKENQARLGSTIQAQQQLEKQGKPSDIASAKKYQENVATAEQQGVDPRTGKKVPSSNAYAFANAADANAQNAGIVASSKGTAIAIEGLGKVSETAAGKIAGIYKSPAQMKSGIEGAGGGPTAPARKTDKDIKPYDGGTMRYGSLFEDFGKESLAKLHGKEAILTEDQMKNLVKGVQTSSMPDLTNVKTPPPMNPESFKSVFTDMQKNMKMPSGFEKITGGIPNVKDMFAGIQTKVSGIVTDAKTKSEAIQKSQTEQPKTVAERSAEADAQQASASTGGEEVTQKDMLMALNDLNKQVAQLIHLQDANNNIAEGMQRKISSNNRFVA